jgi:hypothetical protein
MFSNSLKPLIETEFPPLWRVSNDKEIIHTSVLGMKVIHKRIIIYPMFLEEKQYEPT